MYKGTHKKVNINNETYDAFFPTKHSEVKGIVFKFSRINRNAGDDWANCSDWVTNISLYVMWKYTNDWEKIVDGDHNTSKYRLDLGWNFNYRAISIDDLLFQMESSSIRNKSELREKIKTIKKDIKNLKESLKIHEKDLKNYTSRLVKKEY